MNQDNETQHEMVTAHDEWLELCALATTNDLTTEERARLEEHLTGCAECREVYRQYSALAHEGLPPLAGSYSPGPTGYSNSELWDSTATKTRLLAMADSVAKSGSGHREHSGKTFKNRNAALAIGFGIAAMIVLAVGLGAGYRLGKQAGSAPPIATMAANAADVEVQKRALDLRLDDETKRVAELETLSAGHEKEITGLRTQLVTVNEEAAQSSQGKAAEDQVLNETLTERDTLQSKLHEAQQNYDAVQQELATLRTQRQQDQLHYASLEMEVADLHHRLSDAESRASDSTQFLAQDRDIRELMGARQLYIADVNDMDANGEPRKPFGRVFYTKGKSLVFYAFDLDQQPGVRRASTFQAWAHEGSDRTHPVSLGIFYVDNEANRRWALKADDPKVLAEINSVFVTVEPKGGSQTPTGKPLLYAYLKSETPNHP